MLFALSVQLCLYAVAWLLMGVAFGLARQAVVSWSSAWAIVPLVTFWLSQPALAAIPGTPEVVNFAAVMAFVLQLWGTSKATQLPQWARCSRPPVTAIKRADCGCSQKSKLLCGLR